MDETPVWKKKVLPAETEVVGERQVHRFHIQLEEALPRVQPLPGLKVRFRKVGGQQLG